MAVLAVALAVVQVAVLEAVSIHARELAKTVVKVANTHAPELAKTRVAVHVVIPHHVKLNSSI